jgi:hypothetical protein
LPSLSVHMMNQKIAEALISAVSPYYLRRYLK